MNENRDILHFPTPVIADKEAKAAHVALAKRCEEYLRNPDDVREGMALSRDLVIRDLADADEILELNVSHIQMEVSKRLIDRLDATGIDADDDFIHQMRIRVAKEWGADDVLDLLENDPERYQAFVTKLIDRLFQKIGAE